MKAHGDGGGAMRFAMMVLAGLVVMSVLAVVINDTTRLLAYLPWLLLVACLLMHIFMHRGHGHGHGGPARHESDDTAATMRSAPPDGRRILMNLESRLASDFPPEVSHPRNVFDAQTALRLSRRIAMRQAVLSIAVMAAVIGLPVLGFLYAAAAHDHEHDSAHDGVAQQALLPRIPIVIGTGAADGEGRLVLRIAPTLDVATPGGVDEREP